MRPRSDGRRRARKGWPGKELQVHGSGQLTQTLMAHHLIDAFRLFVYPVVLGTGRRLFNHPGAAGAFRLADTRTTRAGMVVLTYQPAGAPQHGSFALDPEPDTTGSCADRFRVSCTSRTPAW